MKYILSIMLGIFLVTGCSAQPENEGSYAATINVNGNWYDGTGEENQKEYTVDKKLGEVTKKVEPNQTPSENFQSNYLEAGTSLFSSRESEHIILAETKEGEFEYFEKR